MRLSSKRLSPLRPFKHSLLFLILSLLLINAGAQNKKDTVSYIQTLDITTGKIDTLLKVNQHFEAPNWHPDNYLILNSYGKLYTLDIASKKIALLNTGSAIECNNDHGLSPDKKWLAISNNNRKDTSDKPYHSAIYVLPVTGGEPKLITQKTPSYWHGWSADGKTLAYCAERNNNYDIYTIGVDGGEEKRITKEEGLDDGPDYSPDGNIFILILTEQDICKYGECRQMAAIPSNLHLTITPIGLRILHRIINGSCISPT